MKLFIFNIFIATLLLSCEKNTSTDKFACDNNEENLVVYFPFNGSEKNQSIYNVASNSFNIELTTDKNNLENSAAYFNGNSYIELLNEDIIDYSKNDFTICAWIYTNRTSFAYVVSKTAKKNENGRLSYGGGPYSLDIFPGNTRGMFRFDNKYDIIELNGKEKIKKNEWQHIALTWTNGIASLYYNGNLEKSRKHSFKKRIIQTNGNTYFGAYKWGFPNAAFKGKLDNVRIYNRSLSANEIKYLFENYK